MQMQNGRFLLLTLYLALALGFLFGVPLFEAPDEHHHYYTVRYIADNWELPIAQESLARQEAAQPPLYYLIGAILVSPIDVETDWQPVFNPYVRLGEFNAPQNQNAFIHGTEPTKHTLAMRLLRLYSVLLGAGTLWLIGSLGHLLWGQQAGLLAMGITAVWPQFLFLHSSVTNDTQIIFLCTLGLWLLLKQLREPTFPKNHLTLSFIIICAIWTKMTGLGLLVIALGIIGLHQMQKRQWQLAPFLRVALPALTAIAPLFWRNLTHYGDVTAVSAFVSLAGGNRGWSIGQALAELDRVWLSSFAIFGWMNVPAPTWVFWVWGSLMAIALFGWLFVVARKKPVLNWPHSLPFLLFGGWFGLVFVAWLQFMMQTSADQGRLLFPAFASLVLFMVGGWQPLGKGAWGLIGLGGATAVATLFFTLPQAYTATILATLPPEATPIQTNLSETITIIGITPEQTHVQAGETAWFTVYWQGEGDARETAVYTLLGYNQEPVGKVHTLFRLPSPLWQKDDIIAERIGVHVDHNATTPTLATLYVSLLEHGASAEVAQLKLTGRWAEEPAIAPVARVGEAITLKEVTRNPQTAQPAETILITVTWHIEATIEQEYITFMHLGDPTQAPLAQADGLAREGNYPPSQWEAGEQFSDVYRLTIPPDLPAGQYPLQMGLYNPQTGVRLPVTSANGEPFPHSAYPLGELTVVLP